MNHVLTLIGNPVKQEALSQRVLDNIMAALDKAGAETGTPATLAPGMATDITFGNLLPDQALAAAREALAGLPIDAVAQSTLNRRKKVLLADMESTIIQQEMLDELAELVGLRDQIAEITRRAMNGEIDFKNALRERVALLKNLPVSALDQVAQRIEPMPGARTLVATMKANGAHCALVSGGFRTFTRLVRDDIGFHEDFGNDLIIVEGHLTGTVAEPILDQSAKLNALRHVCEEREVELNEALTVGDGANDLSMIRAAGLGIAYHAKPKVASQARNRIDHGDLTALLYAQGYHRDEFREG